MTAKKWQLVEKQLYKLSATFEKCIDALHHARILNREFHAILLKTSEKEWAIYWRPRDDIQCESKVYRIEGSSTKNQSQLNG